MSAVKDPEYNECLYGRTGTDSVCNRCARPADYLTAKSPGGSWQDSIAWCLTCRPRRGRPPHHGERYVRAWIHTHTCACGRPATSAITAPGDPALSQLRRGHGVESRPAVLSRATAYCDAHVPVQTLGPHGSAAAHPYANPDLLREALTGPGATSFGAIARLLGVKDGGTTTRALLRNHAAHTAADPDFPALPTPRTQAEWGAAAWAARRAATQGAAGTATGHERGTLRR